MAAYAVIEVKKGLTIVPLAPGESAESAASKRHGLVADPGPYRSYLDAYEALLHLSSEDSEEEVE
ncbi:MAG: hypothetical protein HUU20_11460 [Pirellulales bacterium]|nr:hypothetical protein [Pirellulales bacterium]